MVKWLKNVWDKHFLVLEAVVPAILVAIASLICYSSDCIAEINEGLNTVRSSIYTALLSMYGALFGFIVTAISILTTFVEKDAFIKLRAHKAYPQFWKVFNSTLRWLAIASFVHLLALLLDKDTRPMSLMWALSIYATTVTVLRLYRCTWLMSEVTKAVAPPIINQPKLTDKS